MVFNNYIVKIKGLALHYIYTDLYVKIRLRSSLINVIILFINDFYIVWLIIVVIKFLILNFIILIKLVDIN